MLAREGNMETRLGGAVAAHKEWSGLVVCSNSVDGGTFFTTHILRSTQEEVHC